MELLDAIFLSFIYVLKFLLTYDLVAIEGQVAAFILKGMYFHSLVFFFWGVLQKEETVETIS